MVFCARFSDSVVVCLVFLVEVTYSILILIPALGLFVNLFNYIVVGKQPLTNCTYRRYRFGMSSK